MRVEFPTFNLTEYGVSIYHSKYRMNLYYRNWVKYTGKNNVCSSFCKSFVYMI